MLDELSKTSCALHLTEKVQDMLMLCSRVSQPVVREGLPGGTRVTSIFSQKPGFHSFLIYVSGFVSKKYKFPVACYS